MKLKSVIPVIIAIFLNSCISTVNISKTSGLSEEDLNEIPLNSKIVLIERADNTAKTMYDEIVDILIDRGHRIIKEDKERNYLLTEGKDLGESTSQRMTIVVTNTDHLSKAKILTEWKPTVNAVTTAGGVAVQTDWQAATYRVNKIAGIAFAETVSVAKKIKDGKITYAP